ncbi:hypothetical protein [Tunturiibacter gelidiferens]|uniref:hypothetical protein n=1 Tax=Tunturiibacter gelidiferens TaxID=3069689 RepID=UPI003D9ABC56
MHIWRFTVGDKLPTMGQPIHIRRICSYDMLEVPANGYVLAESAGEMYFCNARCLCIWAIQLATRPNPTEEQKLFSTEMTPPAGLRRTFMNVTELAQWAAANALGGEEHGGLMNGKVRQLPPTEPA